MAAFLGRRLLKLLFCNNLLGARSVRRRQTISAQAFRTNFRHSAIASERSFAKVFFIKLLSRDSVERSVALHVPLPMTVAGSIRRPRSGMATRHSVECALRRSSGQTASGTLLHDQCNRRRVDIAARSSRYGYGKSSRRSSARSHLRKSSARTSTDISNGNQQQHECANWNETPHRALSEFRCACDHCDQRQQNRECNQPQRTRRILRH